MSELEHSKGKSDMSSHKNHTIKKLLLKNVYASTRTLQKKIHMDSHDKYFAKIQILRIVAGKLISNKLPYSKRNNSTEFHYLTLHRD